MDDERVTQSRHEVGAEEVGLDEPSGDRTARIQEIGEGIRPECAIPDSSLLYTRAGGWRW